MNLKSRGERIEYGERRRMVNLSMERELSMELRELRVKYGVES